MSAYTADQERAVRGMHHLSDWRQSQLITRDQYVCMAADLDPGLRRTNGFLRLTLFCFGWLVALAGVLFLALLFGFRITAIWIVAAAAAAACFAAATVLIRRYQFYRFGVEEALILAGMLFTALATGVAVDRYFSSALALVLALAAAAVAAFIVFFRFGLVYAAVIAAACASLAPFPLLDDDRAARLTGIVILGLVGVAARRGRADGGRDFPGDNYALIETAAWAGIYLFLNLKVSSWLSHSVETGPLYWISYVLIWMLPPAGLALAVRERHRPMLDLNIVLLIMTMMSNKAYLGAAQKPWDPIIFGALLIAVGFGLRRWLSSGDGGARHGLVAYRLLASERDRLAAAGDVSVMQPSLHPPQVVETPQPGFGGGRSGGAGATGQF